MVLGTFSLLIKKTAPEFIEKTLPGHGMTVTFAGFNRILAYQDEALQADRYIQSQWRGNLTIVTKFGKVYGLGIRQGNCLQKT